MVGLLFRWNFVFFLQWYLSCLQILLYSLVSHDPILPFTLLWYANVHLYNRTLYILLHEVRMIMWTAQKLCMYIMGKFCLQNFLSVCPILNFAKLLQSWNCPLIYCAQLWDHPRVHVTVALDATGASSLQVQVEGYWIIRSMYCDVCTGTVL